MVTNIPRRLLTIEEYFKLKMLTQKPVSLHSCYVQIVQCKMNFYMPRTRNTSQPMARSSK